jgi:hypothetical protein
MSGKLDFDNRKNGFLDVCVWVNQRVSCRVGLGAFVAAFFVLLGGFFPFALQGGLDQSKTYFY